MSLLITLVSFFLVLGLLVFVHEMGHYLAARRSGIVVEEFGMGYPPRLIKLFRYDGTDFTLNWVPFGGFARMKGEDASDMSAGSFNAASRWGRAITLFAGPLMNLLLAIILFAVSFMIGGSSTLAAYAQVTDTASEAAQRLGLQVGDIVLQTGETQLLVNALDDPSSVRRPRLPETFTLVISRAGQRQELSNVAVADVNNFLASTAYRRVLTTRIEDTAEASPARQAGIQSGDLIYSVNDTLVTLDSSLTDQIAQNLGKEITLQVVRAGNLVNLRLTPRAEPPAGQGPIGVEVGVMATYATLPVWRALGEGARNTFHYVTLVLQLPLLLFSGQIDPGAAAVSGPIGIAREVGGAANYSIDSGNFWPLWQLAAILSAALAITNLLPLPALDGGRLLFILIETIRGRRVNPEREGYVHMVGFMVLLSLMVLITVRDIMSPQPTINWVQMLGQ